MHYSKSLRGTRFGNLFFWFGLVVVAPLISGMLIILFNNFKDCISFGKNKSVSFEKKKIINQKN